IFDDRAPCRVFVEAELRRGFANLLEKRFWVIVCVQVKLTPCGWASGLRLPAGVQQGASGRRAHRLQEIASDHFFPGLPACLLPEDLVTNLGPCSARLEQELWGS